MGSDGGSMKPQIIAAIDINELALILEQLQTLACDTITDAEGKIVLEQCILCANCASNFEHELIHTFDCPMNLVKLLKKEYDIE